MKTAAGPVRSGGGFDAQNPHPFRSTRVATSCNSSRFLPSGTIPSLRLKKTFDKQPFS
jgi:hypothetical protein